MHLTRNEVVTPLTILRPCVTRRVHTDVVKYLLLASVVYLHTTPVVYLQREPVSAAHATVYAPCIRYFTTRVRD